MNFNGIGFIDILPLIATVHRQRAWFDKNTMRQRAADSPHHDTKCIPLRGPKDPTEENWFEDVPQVDYGILGLKDWDAAKKALIKISRLMTRVYPNEYPPNEPVKLGKAMIVSLKPGGFVDWHVDEGPYYERYLRFHIPLYTNPKAVLYSGGEGMNLMAGGVVFFNNRVIHSAINAGPVQRIHLIADIRKTDA